MKHTGFSQPHPAETDLNRLRLWAGIFLELEVLPTRMSPIVVKHPFTDCGIVGLREESGLFRPVNIMEDGDALHRWRESLKERVRRAKTPDAIFWMITKPYRLCFLKHIAPSLSKQDMARFLAEAWTSSEAPNQDPNVGRRELRELFRQADPRALMRAEEYQRFQELEETVTVYRGVTAQNGRRIKGLSWTLDRDKAEWFANRYGGPGAVYEARIERRHIYALFTRRNENEVVVDTKKLTGLLGLPQLTGQSQTMQGGKIMPNYVENRIRLEGSPEQIHAMLEAIQRDDVGTGSVDFNKILPMPKSLDIEAGSRTDRGLKAYRAFIQAHTAEMPPEAAAAALQAIPAKDEAAYLRQRKDIRREEWALGKAAWNNLRQCGAATWYEWCIQHWGTKWNACSYEGSGTYFDRETLSFQTAWSPPHPVMVQLARQFPEITFTHQWADEDMGQNCGERVYRDGQQTEEYLPEQGQAAVEFACELWGLDPAEPELAGDGGSPEPEMTMG